MSTTKFSEWKWNAKVRFLCIIHTSRNRNHFHNLIKFTSLYGPRFRRLGADILQRRIRLDPTQLHVRFVVDEVELWQVLLHVLRLYPVGNVPSRPHIHYSACTRCYTGSFIMFPVITNIYNRKTKGPTLMELFTATGKLKKIFFWQLEMFDVCTTGGTAYIDTIFKFLPPTRQYGCTDILHCCNDPFL